jgi:hypothetical protein
VIRLPDGRIACADYREPVVKAMRKANDALSTGKLAAPETYATVAKWLDANGAQSALCHAAIGRAAECGH